MFRYKFLDKRFPPDERSLGSRRGKPRFDPKDVIWVRARDYCGNQLFQDGGIHPQDVAQGRVGDCWLIAAIACVAAHEPQILRRAFVTKQTNRRGKYQVRIFDRSARAWEVVSIDENIPLQRSSRAPIFAQSLIMWVVLLEKGAHPGSCTDPPAASLASPRATRATRPRRAPASHVPLCIDVRARAPRLASPLRSLCQVLRRVGPFGRWARGVGAQRSDGRSGLPAEAVRLCWRCVAAPRRDDALARRQEEHGCEHVT
jgi:hypothetical protein